MRIMVMIAHMKTSTIPIIIGDKAALPFGSISTVNVPSNKKCIGMSTNGPKIMNPIAKANPPRAA